VTNGAVTPSDPDAGIPGLARLRALVATLDACDPSRRGHSQRVAYYSVLIAVRLKARMASVQRLMLAAQLHDVGCVAVPERVLETTARFGDELRELVEAHVVEGERALVNLGLVHEATWVRHHHERWDGNGYPDRLAGDSIPLESRIIAGAERLHALRSARLYRLALTTSEAAGRLEAEAGRVLDPDVARIGMALLDEGVLSTGPIGAG
jgi:HD-GYP domain-containing protein (c-di-GMP phosphodiesterase class II)